MNILHISPDLEIACGRTRYVISILNLLSEKDNRLFLASNKIKNKSLKIPENVIFKKIDISPNNRNPINFISSLIKIRNIIISNEIDIVHTHHRYAELLAFLVRKVFFLKFKLLSSIHSITYIKFPLQYRSDKLIAVSNYVKEHLIYYHKIDADNIEVIHNFVDSNFFNNTYISTFKQSKYLLFSAGRFHKEKNFICLLNALKILIDEELSLIIIGEGDQKNNYLDFIRNNNLENKVKLFEPTIDISNFYIDADLCILPSKSETLGFFILEAGLFNKAVIAPSVGGIKEIIINNINGLFFDPDNSNDLAEKIMIALENVDLRNKLGKNLNLTVKNNFNKELHLKKIMNIYKK